MIGSRGRGTASASQPAAFPPAAEAVPSRLTAPPWLNPRVVQDLLKDHCDPVVEPGHKSRGINTL